MEPIESLIPHRPPFLYVDELEDVTDERIVGYKTFTEAEYFFAGHFPAYPVVPGVILVESLAQCGGAGIGQLKLLGDKLFFLVSIDGVKIRRQVRPGETVRLEVANKRVSGSMIRQSGRALVEDQLACEASWMCLAGNPDEQR